MILFKKTLEFKMTFSLTWLQAFLTFSLLLHFGLLFHVKYDLLAPFQEPQGIQTVSVKLRSETKKVKKPVNTRPSKDSKNLNHLLSMLEESQLSEYEEQDQDDQGLSGQAEINFDELMSSLLNDKNQAALSAEDESNEVLVTQKITEMISSKTDQFQGCYEQRLLSGDVLEGHADFLLIIKSYQVADVAIDFKGRGHPKQIEMLKNCLREVSKTVRFSEDLGQQKVKFGLVLKS